MIIKVRRKVVTVALVRENGTVDLKEVTLFTSGRPNLEMVKDAMPKDEAFEKITIVDSVSTETEVELSNDLLTQLINEAEAPKPEQTSLLSESEGA